MAKEVIGGGAKKVLYTLNTLRKIGPGKAAKALNSKNACKACALGMGGQHGGMTNEAGEFPSICNKSVQAQSTDIQPAIPHAIFEHPIHELRDLDAKQTEELGRLDTPIFKEKGADRYGPITWDQAFAIAAYRLSATEPDKSFFYSSGRSSNEAGFLFQLLARMYGTNNVTNCSYYCHQATSVALGETVGTGTATIELQDLDGCDLIFVIGANPSSNHPRFIHKLQACRARGGHVIMINPAKEPGLVKFAVPKSPKSMLRGGDEIASLYLQPKIGADIALLKGIAKAVLEAGDENIPFLKDHAAGLDGFKHDLDALSWDTITRRTAVPKSQIEAAAKLYGRSTATVFAWGMGMTHHLHGVDNIKSISNLALLRGMIGQRQKGLLPLRGHSNVQGIGTIGVKPVLPEQVIAHTERHFGITFPKKKGLDTMASMQVAAQGKIDAAVIMGGNLYAANPNSAWAADTLNKIGFKLFMTTTLNKGHLEGIDAGESLILPVTARDEEWEPTTQESMFNYVRLSDGGINRLANVRPETVILAELARRILPDAPIDFSAFGKHREIRKAIAEIIPGMENLADIDIAKQEFHIQNRLMHTPRFNKPDGKAHFSICPLPEEQKVSAEDGTFLLTTMRSEGQFNSIIYENSDTYRGTETRWSVLMNRSDMQVAGITAGDTVSVRSAQGVMENVTVYEFNLPKGSMMAYYPEANVLTATEVDAKSKTPSFKSTLVHIDRADTG